MLSLIERKCIDCNTVKNYKEFYYQTKLNQSGEEYIYCPPRCKKCAIKTSRKWQSENYKKYLEKKRVYQQTKRNTSLETREMDARNRKEYSESGRYLEWQRNNKDKTKEYSLKRSNKNHTISNKEWNKCKEYFNHRCAYCGMTEEEHKKKYRQQLHKEHVIHEGRNDIKNCVPSCKSCNSSKHIDTLNVWYNKDNVNYTRERYLKIYQWIRYDCRKL